MARDLELYYRNFCPFCRKVLDYVDAHDIDLSRHCLQEEVGAEAHLLELGGKAQVPCLVIDGRALYESDDIIGYLERNVVAAESATAATTSATPKTQ